ncbi:hypothetical protein Aconfl_23070 [Algoriphagus confluentis]|uniref:Uncharacterized protein n=1 Tax=Algoriphagus confluentis TaxID=1697556 RepID=A0ABQ6PNY9_9BACT|nr:hypothetical protein Aconfl_23070 [Algoriphagus confluentis]
MVDVKNGDKGLFFFNKLLFSEKIWNFRPKAELNQE